MSHYPEILVSRDRAVLREIRSAFTYAVCWELTEVEAQEMARHSDIYGHSRLGGYSPSGPESAQSKQILLGFMEHFLPEFDDVISPKAKRKDESKFSILYAPPGHTFRDSGIPHIDPGVIRVFGAFNDHMGATRCIPHEFAGACTGKGHYYPSEDLSKAVSFPGLSISIIDIGRQVHMAPEKVPSAKGRVWLELSYYK